MNIIDDNWIHEFHVSQYVFTNLNANKKINYVSLSLFIIHKIKLVSTLK